MTPPRTLLVDLDGTLLDTAPDMGAALNALRAEHGRAPMSADVMRPQVSHGAFGLVRLGFGDCDDTTQASLRQRFVELYRTALTSHGTALFPGFAALLATLHRAARPWGIVTNKPGWLTAPLLQDLTLPHPPAVVVSGDTLGVRKPHPDPLLHASVQLQCAPSQCLYLGDAERDVVAARAAGMTAVVALWGYLDTTDPLNAWGADHAVGHPDELPALLGVGLA